MRIKDKIFSLIEKLNNNIFPKAKYNKNTLRYLLYEQAIKDSLSFVLLNFKYAEVFEKRENLYKWALDRSIKKGLILEFGVHNGKSINAIAKFTDKKIHGFDSFEGLPMDGKLPTTKDDGVKWYVGKMNNFGKMPNVKKNVKLHKGWFDETLPKFFSKEKEKISLMHIDCDIYSSTLSVLKNSKKNITSGTIIIFDEYLNYEGWQKNEHRAFQEFCGKFKIKFDFIAYTYKGQVAVRIK